jgi:hypothetical protein
MSLTKKQTLLVDALINGGHIWRAGSSSYYLARVVGHYNTGSPIFKSEPINGRTFTALEPLLSKDLYSSGDRWVLK